MADTTEVKEDWMNAKWRPMMGWMYMAVCTSDFIIFPIMWSLTQVIAHGKVDSQWDPITLHGAGLFHMAMGAVLGIAAYGRTQEKLGDKVLVAPNINTPVQEAVLIKPTAKTPVSLESNDPPQRNTRND